MQKKHVGFFQVEKADGNDISGHSAAVSVKNRMALVINKSRCHRKTKEIFGLFPRGPVKT